MQDGAEHRKNLPPAWPRFGHAFCGRSISTGAADPSEADRAFVQAFCVRIRAARKACAMTQADTARLLGISCSAYQRYETRTPLPHHLVQEFAAVTGVDLEELFPSAEEK